MTPHRFTLRGRIGCRETRRLRRVSANLITAIGCYVVSCAIGWACVGVLIAAVWR